MNEAPQTFEGLHSLDCRHDMATIKRQAGRGVP
jgi:hypothetical protein